MLFSPQTRLIPLFLGADLYSDTDIRVENHPRYHAKFAKKGLATKLVFSSGESIIITGLWKQVDLLHLDTV